MTNNCSRAVTRHSKFSVNTHNERVGSLLRFAPVVSHLPREQATRHGPCLAICAAYPAKSTPLTCSSTMMGPPDFRTPSKSNGPLAQLAATPSQPLRTPIHQTSATPIVDLDTIERNKENILQLRGGRSAHALSKSFSTPHKDRTAALEAKRREYETIIASSENAESDDPLEVWYKYVMWVIEAYPAGHSVESGLVSLLERVTRHFKDFAQYRNDPRYLKMWVFYARNVDCARDIYQFCLANEMGTNLATLYEQLAVTYQSSSM